MGSQESGYKEGIKKCDENFGFQKIAVRVTIDALFSCIEQKERRCRS